MRISIFNSIIPIDLSVITQIESRKICSYMHEGTGMYSSMIGKIEKAKRYSEEKGRLKFESFVASFNGDNSDHRLEYIDGILACSCAFFSGHGFCSHSMAVQHMLSDMLQVPLKLGL